MKKLFKYLHLRDVGFLEFTFAITPMLGGFSLGSLPMSLVMWLLLLVIAISKGKFKPKNFVPLTIFIVYWILHQFFIMFVDDVNFVGFLQQLIWFGAVYVLFPILNLQKLRGALNWVALISIAGLLYQWGIISAGGEVGPLGIPGLTMSDFRMEGLSVRPSSFYMEPATYVSFMICPLALALIEKKYAWSIAIILSIFLTTSTTGLVLSFIMLVMSLFANKIKTSSVIGVLAVGVGLFYVLTHFSAFDYGVNKLETTDVEKNVRLSQAPYIVSTMYSSEYLFGAPYSTPYNYCISGRATDVIYYGNTVYMSTFWSMILLYGVIGLILYLNIYYRIFRMSKVIWPLLACLLATMFSDPDNIQGSYIYKLIFMLVLAIDDVKERFRPNNSLVK